MFRAVTEITEKIGINETNAAIVVRACYDSLMMLARARMLLDGFKAAGNRAHEAEVSYLLELGLPETDVLFLDELRKARNSLVYYGKEQDPVFARKVLEFSKRLWPILEKLATKQI